MTADAFARSPLSPLPPVSVMRERGAGGADMMRCAHCGTALLEAGDRFCCAGCAAAYALVNRLGLAQYYARRTDAPEAPPATEVPDPAEIAAYVRTEADGTHSLSAMLGGLRCAACLWLIESALGAQDGVLAARVAFSTGRLHLRWQGPAARGADLLALVCRLGYQARPYDPALVSPQSGSAEERTLLRSLAVAGFAAGNIMLLSIAVWAGHAGEMGGATRDLFHWVSALIALPAVAYAGRPFFLSAWTALRAHRTNMDVPISVGVVLAAGASLFATIHSDAHAYFDSAVTLLFFLLIGRYLERRARGLARSSAEALLAIGAAPVTRIAPDGSTARVAPAALNPGDTILVAAGERIGADGTIVAGRSEVDRSLIDGETLPRTAVPGDTVFAGMTNLSGALRVRVAATGEATYLAGIARLVEAAEHGRSRYVVLADRVARGYAPVVHLLALASFAGWLALGLDWKQALMIAVAVLIITCPCALGLAIPAVQVVAAGRLMRRGILLKSATAMERLAAIDTVVFDKTGTLTLGRPALVTGGEVDPLALKTASALAAGSRHPLSRAVRALCPDAPAAEGVVEHPGAGLSWRGPDGEVRLGRREFCGITAPDEEADGPELWLARPGENPVRFVFEDRLREDASAVVETLRRAGKRVVLLSGDRTGTVARVAASLGIAEWAARQSPAEKTAFLAALASEGRRVLMVGDGLNDAPALVAAHASMSPASGADISQNAADIVFQGDRLGAVGEALDVAHRSRALVRQNLAFAILYNVVAVPLAIAGMATPLVAAIAMSSSSIVVVLNALRLRAAMNTLSTPHEPRTGGEGWGEVGKSRTPSETHLTLPPLPAPQSPAQVRGGKDQRGAARQTAEART